MLMAPCHAENQWLSLMKPSRLSSSKLWRLNHQTLSNIGVKSTLRTGSGSKHGDCVCLWWASYSSAILATRVKVQESTISCFPPCWDGDDFGTRLPTNCWVLSLVTPRQWSRYRVNIFPPTELSIIWNLKTDAQQPSMLKSYITLHDTKSAIWCQIEAVCDSLSLFPLIS